MREILILLACGILAWTGLEWLVDPKKSLKFNLDDILFFRGGEPLKSYFVIVRVVAILMMLLALLLAGFVLLEGF